MKAINFAKTSLSKLSQFNILPRTLFRINQIPSIRNFATDDKDSNKTKDAFNKAKETVKQKAQQAGDSLKEKASSAKEKVGEKAQQAKENMSEKMQQAKEKVGEKAQQAKENVSEKMQQAKEKVGEKAQQAKENIQNQMNNPQSTGSKMAQDFKSNMQQADSQMNYWKTQYEEAKDMPIDKLILCDHTAVRTIYDKFKSEKNKDEAEKWRNQLIYEIARHSIAEEIILYPLIRKKLADGENIFQKDTQEQHRIKEILYSAQSIDKDSPDFRAKIDEAMQLLFKHIEGEESEQLPQLRKCLSEEEMIKAGNQYMRRKFIVPTKPHTAVPEDPPTLNSILGLLTAPLDKFRDLFTAFPDQEKMADIKKKATEHVHTHDKSGSCCDENKH